MNAVEQEAIILNTAWEMIDGMVNWVMFSKYDNPNPSNLLFQTSQHARLFNILLGDFLSQLTAFNGASVPLGLKPAPSSARPTDLTFLFYLRQVCADPQMGTDTQALGLAVESFADWLESEALVEGVNLGSIDVVTDIRVPRYRYLKICGDIAKHNPARLAANVRHIRQLLEANGHAVSEYDGYLAIPDFYDWFHTNIFIYHSSLIGEALNAIRWAIFDYLRPEYRRAWHRIDIGVPDMDAYGYHYPSGCVDAMARAMYWSLMNHVRSRPWMDRFSINQGFRDMY
jgi:hypothetical protein